MTYLNSINSDEDEILRDQLEYLIGHARGPNLCKCSDCQRYWHVRRELLQIFEEPKLAETFTNDGEIAMVQAA